MLRLNIVGKNYFYLFNYQSTEKEKNKYISTKIETDSPSY